MRYSRKCIKDIRDRFNTELCASEMRDSILYLLDGRVSCGEGLAFGKKEYLDSKITLTYSTGFSIDWYDVDYEEENFILEAFKDRLYSRALCIYGDVKDITGCCGYFAIGDIKVEVIRNFKDEDNEYDKYIIKTDVHYNKKDCRDKVLDRIRSIEIQREVVDEG